MTFNQLGLNETLNITLSELGYEAPTPVQAQSIPILLSGSDLLAQAQTGTGKTAAFALPILSRLDATIKAPQALILAPTRELALQVAEAFQSYAKYLKDFHVTPIYGGQNYRTQLRSLQRGTHIIVGTPGRIMDHLERGSLKLDQLKTVVLDEADEMLKMGFIDDIEWILEHIKHPHQTALFSATMPPSIQKITNRYLSNPQKVHIKPKKNTVASIEQCFMCLHKEHKLDALTRLLEVEETQATIIFVRTKNDSSELAQKLQARGYAASALNGDMDQNVREKVINQIKNGNLDIVVATDVAARGIDVDRVSHVINFDIPSTVESYTHRIGRTGRAGRSGKAILFITPRERRLLKDIERATQSEIKQMSPPSLQEMTDKRGQQLNDKIADLILTRSRELAPYYAMVDSIATQSECDFVDIAAALAYLSQQTNPLPENELKTAKVNQPATKRKEGRAFSNTKNYKSRPTDKQKFKREGKRYSSASQKKRTKE